MYVCLFVSIVHLSARLHISKTARPNFGKFLYVLPVAVDWSSSDDGNAICYVLPVLWMDVMFHHNAGNRPESKTTRIFCRVHQVAAPVSKCAVFDWILLPM